MGQQPVEPCPLIGGQRAVEGIEGGAQPPDSSQARFDQRLRVSQGGQGRTILTTAPRFGAGRKDMVLRGAQRVRKIIPNVALMRPHRQRVLDKDRKLRQRALVSRVAQADPATAATNSKCERFTIVILRRSVEISY